MECKNVRLIYPNKKSEYQIMLLLRVHKTGYCKLITSKNTTRAVVVC